MDYLVTKYRDDELALMSNVLMTMAIAARADFRQPDWPLDRRRLYNTPVQQAYLDSLSTVVWAAQDITKDRVDSPEIFRDIVNAVRKEFPGGFNDGEFAWFLTEGYLFRHQQYIEQTSEPWGDANVTTTPAIHVAAHTHQPDCIKQEVPTKPPPETISEHDLLIHRKAIRPAAPVFDIQEFMVTFDHIIDRVAQKYIRLIARQAKVDSSAPRKEMSFPHRRLEQELLILFATHAMTWRIIDPQQVDGTRLVKEEQELIGWIIDSAAAKREEMFGQNGA